MDLSKVLTISGKPDLFKHIAQSKNGIIVESLIDGKRLNAFASMRVSSLHEISIYTEGEDVPLEDVFKNIYKKVNGEKAIDHKSSAEELKTFFEEALPEYDKEKVYVSDIKRVVKWYNILQEKGMVDLEEPEKTENEEEVKDEVKAETKETEVKAEDTEEKN